MTGPWCHIRYPHLLCRAWQAVGALFDAVAHTSVATEERAKTIMWRARRQFKKKAKVAEAGTYLYFTSLLAFVVAAKAARPAANLRPDLCRAHS